MKTFEDKISYNINHFSEQYNKEFNQKISSFISLGIENQYDLSLHGERDCRDITIELLLKEMLESNMNRIALLGGPGAGKSTLLLKMAILLTTEEYNLDSYIPVLIKCGLEKTDEVENLIHISGFSKEGKKQLLEEGRLFLIFDGINEVSNMEINDFLNKIYLLSEDYPECKYIVSCRSLEFPVTEYNPFEKYTVF